MVPILGLEKGFSLGVYPGPRSCMSTVSRLSRCSKHCIGRGATNPALCVTRLDCPGVLNTALGGVLPVLPCVSPVLVFKHCTGTGVTCSALCITCLDCPGV